MKKTDIFTEVFKIQGKEILSMKLHALDEPYFKLVLEFPNGTIRTLYISYKALERDIFKKTAGS